jgi:hypothetical protein
MICKELVIGRDAMLCDDTKLRFVLSLDFLIPGIRIGDKIMNEMVELIGFPFAIA